MLAALRGDNYRSDLRCGMPCTHSSKCGDLLWSLRRITYLVLVPRREVGGRLCVGRGRDEMIPVLAFHILPMCYVEEFTDHSLTFLFELAGFIVVFVILVGFHNDELVCDISNGLYPFIQDSHCLLGFLKLDRLKKILIFLIMCLVVVSFLVLHPFAAVYIRRSFSSESPGSAWQPVVAMLEDK